MKTLLLNLEVETNKLQVSIRLCQAEKSRIEESVNADAEDPNWFKFIQMGNYINEAQSALTNMQSTLILQIQLLKAACDKLLCFPFNTPEPFPYKTPSSSPQSHHGLSSSGDEGPSPLILPSRTLRDEAGKAEDSSQKARSSLLLRRRLE